MEPCDTTHLIQYRLVSNAKSVAYFWFSMIGDKMVSCDIYKPWSGIAQPSFWHAKNREYSFEIFKTG